MIIAETVLDGRVERFRMEDAETSDGCFDPMNEFSAAFYDVVVKEIPFCKRLAWRQLETCAILKGDKIAAADIANLLEKLLYPECSKEEWAMQVRQDFSLRAVFKTADGIRAPEGDNAAQQWRRYACEQIRSFGVSSIEAHGDDAEVHGSVRAYRFQETRLPNHPREFSSTADYVQKWRRGPEGRFLMTEWNVGAFSKEIEDP